MAEALKRRYDISVLKVELLAAEPNVRFTLQGKIDGMLRDLREWRSDTTDLGFPRETGRGRQSDRNVEGNLSVQMLDEVREWLASREQEDAPLWVHLVRPYGLLRFIPWERALGRALPVPIIMLPDFIFPPPREAAETLEVALCASAALDVEEHQVYAAAMAVVDAILSSSPRELVRLHIFTDDALAGRLREQGMEAGRLGLDVFVHDPAEAASFASGDGDAGPIDEPGRLRSPWLRWMREALRARSVDVVHFCCHGWLSRDRGALLLAESPLERTRRWTAGPIAAGELGTFLTQVGAWSAAFTSVEGDNSEPGLRSLADDIAQSRPGPMFMHTMAGDHIAQAVVEAYRFLYATEPEDPPRRETLLMYCQPYRVKQRDGADSERRVRGHVAHPVARNARQVAMAEHAMAASPMDAILQSGGHVQPWLASTERFAEQVHVRLQQGTRGEAEPPPDDERRLHAEEQLAMLDRLRAAVARVAGKTDGGHHGPGGAA